MVILNEIIENEVEKKLILEGLNNLELIFMNVYCI